MDQSRIVYIERDLPAGQPIRPPADCEEHRESFFEDDVLATVAAREPDGEDVCTGGGRGCAAGAAIHRDPATSALGARRVGRDGDGGWGWRQDRDAVPPGQAATPPLEVLPGCR